MRATVATGKDCGELEPYPGLDDIGYARCLTFLRAEFWCRLTSFSSRPVRHYPQFSRQARFLNFAIPRVVQSTPNPQKYIRMHMTIRSGADSENLSLIEYLNRHLELISQSREEEFPARHEAFVAGLQDYSAQQLGSADIAHYAGLFCAFQRRYLAFKERLAAEHLSQVLAESSDSIGDQLTDRFARDSYQRVKELRVLADLGACRRLVMVGCGAFPATLLWFSDQLPAIDYIGLDIEPDCVLLANRMAGALGRRNLRFKTVDGCDFDYSGADFVYVANQVAPKRKVLERLLQYATPQLQVVVREPTHLGELLAAPVRSDLPPGFAVCASGPVSQAFLSYDLLLRWEGRA